MNDHFLNINWHKRLEKTSIDESVAEFNRIYEEACLTFIPLSTKNVQRHKIPWTNKNLRKAISAKKQAWHKLKASSNKNKNLRNKYKYAKRRLKPKIKENITE
jgi:hypothetical protein